MRDWLRRCAYLERSLARPFRAPLHADGVRLRGVQTGMAAIAVAARLRTARQPAML